MNKDRPTKGLVDWRKVEEKLDKIVKDLKKIADDTANVPIEPNDEPTPPAKPEVRE